MLNRIVEDCSSLLQLDEKNDELSPVFPWIVQVLARVEYLRRIDSTTRTILLDFPTVSWRAQACATLAGKTK